MEPCPVKIFVCNNSPRLRYVADLIFSHILGIPYEIITDRRRTGKNPVINYSGKELKDSFRISPSGLLDEQGVRPLSISISDWQGIPVFFTSDNNSDIPFDVFAAIFFMVSRYEEYLQFNPDKHGRFPASHSLAFRNNFLYRPVVNLWIKELARLLVLKYPELVFRKKQFTSIVTFDVDEPFKYRGKDVIRHIGRLIFDIGKKNHDPAERYRTVTGKLKDPWDIFDYLIEKAEESGAELRVFIPSGDRSAFDKWPSWNNEDYRNLVYFLSGRLKTGLHPSYMSYNNIKRLKTEKTRLENLISSEISSSRYHYIRLKFPDSYLNLITAGIKEDYSMGFPDEPGFRAGIATPFYFYNLSAEQKTNLLVFPFQIMDATLSIYRKMKPEEAICLVEELIDETKNAGGIFHSVWHNNILAEGDKSVEWRALFEHTLKYQRQ